MGEDGCNRCPGVYGSAKVVVSAGPLNKTRYTNLLIFIFALPPIICSYLVTHMQVNNKASKPNLKLISR